jgi:leucine dehydrogenase
MWAYGDARLAVRDVLRLSRAMTFKAAVADLPLGGGKGAIMVPPDIRLSPGQRRAALLDFGDLVQTLDGRYVTAEDVGTSSRDMSVIAAQTPYVAGLARSRGGSGDPSPYTALGVEVSIRAACERAFGDPSLRGRRICVLGLGHVGSRVAKRCARGGARLIVADVDEHRRTVGRQLGATWAAPEVAWESEVDVLAPCALGGLLDDETVPRLRCQVIAGAANNQLASEGIAERLQSRGILWAPDFVANAGGLINIAQEQGGYDPALARRRVGGIAETLSEIFDRSDATGQTPLGAAMDLAARRLAVGAGTPATSAGPAALAEAAISPAWAPPR